MERTEYDTNMNKKYIQGNPCDMIENYCHGDDGYHAPPWQGFRTDFDIAQMDKWSMHHKSPSDMPRKGPAQGSGGRD
jgi:hypothetical protein